MADNPVATPALGSPALGNATCHLLEQEVEINEKLEVLVPATYTAKISQELLMLRCKLRSLQTYARRHGTLGPSDINGMTRCLS